MKCQHCGKNEATFYFKSNINGQVTKVHLCQDCAEKLGYTEQLRDSFRPMNLFSDNDFFGRTITPFESLFGGLGTRLLTEFPSPMEEEKEPAPADLVSGEEQEQLKRQRKKNALETQLRAAIEAEDFESAARLRDELKALE